MSKINLLSEEIINKIAAGEVIERPAAVVKELLENSLDAQAKKIFITVEDYGLKLISVADDGLGMEEEDAKLAILRHATSKINSAEDLFSINTLGFRGEALASIAAVSNLTILTLPRGKLEGFELVVESGRILRSSPVAANYGTVMEVRNLFFNTPARKKFLKTESVELKHIIEVVEHYALINSSVHFRLVHDNKVLIDSPATNSWRDKISTIYDARLARDLLEVNHAEEGVKISGFVAKPYQARNDKNLQFFYVNRRWIKNEELSKAVYDAYHSLLFVNKHPILFLNLDLDAEKVDVNVHPTKELVKFEQKALVNRLMFSAIKETLQKNNLIPTMKMEMEEQRELSSISAGHKEESLASINENLASINLNDVPEEDITLGNGTEDQRTKNKINENIVTSNNYSENNLSADLMVRERGIEFRSEEINLRNNNHNTYNNPHNNPHNNLNNNPPNITTSNDNNLNNYNTSNHPTTRNNPTAYDNQTTNSLPINLNKIPEMRLIGQVRKTFFIAESDEGIIFIDQHVVQERILYEKFMDQYLNKKIAVQSLLQGDIIDFSAAEKVSFKDNKNNLEKLGFIVEEFGERSFLLKSVPAVLGRTQPKELFMEALDALARGHNRLEEIQEEIITRMACRASVKAGDYLSIQEMKKLLEELSKTKLPYTCPHGRSVLIKLSYDELEKKFKRKG